MPLRAAPAFLAALAAAGFLLHAAPSPARAEEGDALRARRAANPPNQLLRRQMVGRDLARRDAERRGDVPPGRGGALAVGAGLGAGRAVLPGSAPARPSASFDELPGWNEDAVAEALPAMLASCRAFGAMTPGRTLGGSGEIAVLGGTPESWRNACAELSLAAASLPPLSAAGRGGRLGQARLREIRRERDARVRSALEANFTPALAGEGLLTAYYEPILRGALAPEAPFLTPLYRRPPELVERDVPGRLRPDYGRLVDGKLEPLPDRGAIQKGALAGRGLELAWVEDPAEAFFLQVQGSGRVVLPDRRVLRVGYAGQNGQPYRAIGRSLIERGAVPEDRMSMGAIRAWMASAGPEAAAALMAENPSYVFFQLNTGLRDDQGPPGAMGVPLTPERSVAVDPAVVPLGAPVFISAVGGGAGAFRRLLAAQDTGGAIRGPGRGDLFRGWGPEAGARAGSVRSPIRMWVLLPRQAPRLAARD